MTADSIPMDLRRVLDAPRGRRFSHTTHRPGARPAARSVSSLSSSTRPEPLPPLVSLGRTPRERELLARMPDTPGLRRRFAYGDLPEWIRNSTAAESGWQRVPEPVPAPALAPEPERAPTEDDEPERPVSIPGPRRESAPPPTPAPPPLPRRSDRPRRPAAHRKPRRRIGHLVIGYALAATAGALGQHLIAFLG